MKLRWLLASALSLLLTVAGCSDRPVDDAAHDGPTPEVIAGTLPDDVKAAGLIAGAEMAVPPMAFFAEDGTTPTGLNYELGQAIATHLGTRLTLQQYSFEGLQPALKTNKIDMIFDVLNDTLERQKQFDFIDYLAAGNTLLLPHGNPLAIKELTGLCGHSMSAVRGSVQIKIVEKASATCPGGSRITINQFPGAADARLQVQNGRADAFIGNTPVLLYIAKTNGAGKVFSAVPLPSTGSYYGIAVSKDNQVLRAAITAALSAIIKDGSYASILAKYGLGEVALEKPLINAATS